MQALGRTVGPQVDVFSLGVSFLEAMLGKVIRRATKEAMLGVKTVHGLKKLLAKDLPSRIYLPTSRLESMA